MAHFPDFQSEKIFKKEVISKMNKTEFVNAVSAKNPSLTKKTVTEVVDSVISTIQETVAAGDSVSFVGFGTFSPKVRAARESINPATKETIHVEEKTVPTFKVGKSFKDAVAEASKPKVKTKNKKSGRSKK